MCAVRSSRPRPWRSCLLALALGLAMAGAGAQDTPPAAPTSESSETAPPPLSPPSTSSRWDDIETRLETLLQAAEQSSMDWDALLTELAQVRAEVERLRSDSQRSLSSFEDYERRTSERIASIEAKAKAEAERARKAERSRDGWRIGTAAASIAALVAFLLCLGGR